LHTTAESHNRVMVLEVMGRYAGWIALYAGVAGGADVILIPEIPFTYDSVCAKIRERESLGKKFTLVIVAEGAREKDADFVTAAGQEANREARLGGIGAVVTAELEKRTGKETRNCVLGHLQRGGSPTTFDRALCSMFGATAVELRRIATAARIASPLMVLLAIIRLSCRRSGPSPINRRRIWKASYCPRWGGVNGECSSNPSTCRSMSPSIRMPTIPLVFSPSVNDPVPVRVGVAWTTASLIR
jgi:hypothetical protein